MSRWFCVKESVEPAVSMLAFVAGGLVKANNPALIEPAKPVAKGLLETIESGASREAVNALLKEVVSTLLEKVDKPEVQLAVKAALSKVSYNADSGDMPDIDLPLIRSLTTGFLEGLTA